MPALVIGTGYGGCVAALRLAQARHGRPHGRDGHGLGHPRPGRQDLRQHHQARRPLLLAADPDQAAAQQLPRLPPRPERQPVHRHPGRRGVRWHHRLPGAGRRRRLPGQRRHGRHPAPGELRRDPPHGRRRGDVQHLLPARQQRTGRHHHRPRLVRGGRLLPVRPGRPEARSAGFPLPLRPRRLRLGLHEAGSGRNRPPVRPGRGDPLRQQPRQEVPPEDLHRPDQGHRPGHHLPAPQGHHRDGHAGRRLHGAHRPAGHHGPDHRHQDGHGGQGVLRR